MRISSRDRTRISFGKLSDPGVLERSPLSTQELETEYFTTQNFQYIVDHIADMFGLAHGSVQAGVIEQDYTLGWLDKNRDSKVDDDEIQIQFTMNAAINTYYRQSYYGKHFMYMAAAQYGYPIIFGIVAHEVGHLINRYTLQTLDTRVAGGSSMLVQTSEAHPKWDELCADYLSGIVLAKALPRLSQKPIIEFLRGTQPDADHPHGFWRVMAVEMGYQWGCNNSPILTSGLLTDTAQLRTLLHSFFDVYYRQIYREVNPLVRMQYGDLPDTFIQPCAIGLGTM